MQVEFYNRLQFVIVIFYENFLSSSELLIDLSELSISCQVITLHCTNIFPSLETDTLSWWDGLRGSMILIGYVAGSFYSLLDRPLGESPDQTQSPGPASWGLGLRLTTSPCKKKLSWKRNQWAY